MHENGFAHMDIKIDNLLLGEDYVLKLSDFDWCYKDGDDVMSPGTIGFRAPELIRGDQNIDPKASDIYSAAIALFMMLFG